MRLTYRKSTFTQTLLTPIALASCMLFPSLLHAQSQPAPGSMNVSWREGAPDCEKASEPPLQIHQYNNQTFIIRESLCSTFEAPFVFLLIGSNRAMLIDTGDVADPAKMPLARTVSQLIQTGGGPDKPLLVVHTHRHLDHRAGDAQFQGLPNTQVVGFDLDSVRRFYRFTEWPEGVAQIDLGDRIVDALSTPGHNETEVSFYDRNTALFFSGDFLIPGHLLIDDTQSDLASAERVAAFVKDRPVSYVLGNHIEENDQGQLYDWQSSFHPREHSLQLTKADLLALPAAIRKFNGFYTHTGNFFLMNSIRILIVCAIGIVVLLLAFALALVRFFRRRRSRRVKAKLANSIRAS